MNYKILIKHRCNFCRGTGRIMRPEWKSYFDGKVMDRPIMSECMDCGDCGGNGHIEKWIPLEELESEAIVNLSARVDALEDLVPDIQRGR